MTVTKSNAVLPIVAFVGLSLAAVAGVLWWTSVPASPPPSPAVQPPPPEPAVGPPPPARAVPGLPPPPPRDVPGIKQHYPEPDGDVPSLNGVQQVVELSWAADRPYARIVGKQTDVNGYQWYEHADGTFTTTYYIWRKDLGRYDAQSIVKHPANPVPMLPEETPGHRSPPK